MSDLNMAREKFCPRCGGDITDSYEAAEPDVGIMSSGWYCDQCELPVPDEDDDNFEPPTVDNEVV